MVLHPVVLLWSISSFIEAAVVRLRCAVSSPPSLVSVGQSTRSDRIHHKAAPVGPRQRSRASGASGGATSTRLERNGAKLAIVFCGFFQCPSDVPSFFLTFWGRLCGYSCGVLQLPRAAGAILCKNPMSQRCPRPRPRPNFASIAW
jgi:hypothetical protein